jgi:amino acid transporter
MIYVTSFLYFLKYTNAQRNTQMKTHIVIIQVMVLAVQFGLCLFFFIGDNPNNAFY